MADMARYFRTKQCFLKCKSWLFIDLDDLFAGLEMIQIFA